jgi:outer membrane lipopolysaccharide assembly protein LptE/RlpB
VNVPQQKVDFESVNQRLDALIAQGKTAEARALVEATAPQLTAKEMLINLRPDIKQRIQGKPELMREYIDVVNTRNANDTVPSVYEHGADYARKAGDEMQKKLNETGGAIGKTRTKLATYKAPIDEVKRIETSFSSQLDKLNLELKGGVIQQKAGTISRVGASGDIKVLQDLYEGLVTFKQSPTLTNLIDLRSSFDAKINFAKRSSEVSNSVDPLSRQVRKDIADTAAKVVGKSNAADLKRYSDFMDAYNDIHSYTDRKAGGEYLLRLVLSGRGGEARVLTQTIKEYTGIDLLDHATMMELTNEMFGNASQKNLFRQEVAKAGLDVARLAGGDPSGAIGTLFEKGVDKFLDKERILMEASQKPNKPL